jgi:hypothetical protein
MQIIFDKQTYARIEYRSILSTTILTYLLYTCVMLNKHLSLFSDEILESKNFNNKDFYKKTAFDNLPRLIIDNIIIYYIIYII